MDIARVIDIIRTLKEDAPTMSMGAGGIAGSVESSNYDPNFTPPVRKKKKKYIYQKGMRKWWMQNG
jgi:hypothetical protein